MSDDLVKRLRNNCICNFPDTPCGFADEECRNSFEAADRIEKLEADLEVATMKRLLDTDRIEKLEAALDDALQYVSRADWYYLKDETRKALEGKDD